MHDRVLLLLSLGLYVCCCISVGELSRHERDRDEKALTRKKGLPHGRYLRTYRVVIDPLQHLLDAGEDFSLRRRGS
jgi:hypothetical protein